MIQYPGLPAQPSSTGSGLLYGHAGWKTTQVLAIIGGGLVPFFGYAGDPGGEWAEPLVFIGCVALFLLPFAGVLSLLADFEEEEEAGG